MSLHELSDEEINEIAAIEVMGWESVKDGRDWRRTEEDGSTTTFYKSMFYPATDRNQSRQVVEAAIEKTTVENLLWTMQGLLECESEGFAPWALATPRQEVEAAILAVRDATGKVAT